MSTNDQNPTAGIGDPYWYEWTVGQGYVVDMLNPDNRIESVTLQATEAQGLDDVVVVYTDGNAKYIQVKHTRKESTITFGDVLSLLPSISKAWKEQKGKWNRCSPVLFTNRKVSSSSKKMGKNTAEYERPALDEFLKHLQSELNTAKVLADIKMPDKWSISWKEWCDQISTLPSDKEKFDFLKLLVIEGNQPELDKLSSEVIQKISKTFGVSEEKATSVFSQLDHALREWGTTFRGNKESINCEDVYKILSMTSTDLIGDHMLTPPEPFFPSRQQFLEDLSNELLTGKHSIIFLDGLPGQGKTSIVSALASQRDPVIDLRYHAFKPITPHTKRLPADAGITTKAEVLWGDLLTELRSFFFQGRLAQFNVPIRNDFLTTEQLIAEVLRLANILGKERGRPTVIAIDGIDHAARAGVDQYSFLDTLIPPDAVPEYVRFLIVGQPAEAYEKYPFWLKERSPDVSYWSVEGIQEEDISRLLAAEVQSLPAEQFEATVRLVNDVAQGNTLAAIFAIEEAKAISNIDDLQAKLANKRLKDGISAYYEKIWSAAVTLLDERYPFSGQRLAGCLSLIKERTTGQDLAKIFSGTLDISPSNWDEALRALRPLVIEENGSFHVIHNDVRVHLTKQIHAQPERLREVASLIADFYWTSPEKGHERHADLFELLRKSDRHVDQARAFTPEYVMEGFALGRRMSELYEQSKQALLHVVDTGDWDFIHNVSCATTTLVQLDKSVDGMDRSFNYIPDVPPYLFSEGKVPNKESWTVDLIYNTMFDAYRLIQANEWDRAYGLMRRWFVDIKPIDLTSIIRNDLLEEINDQTNLTENFKQVLRLWGKISKHVNLLWTQEEVDQTTGDPIKIEIWAHFFDGMMQEALENGEVRDWIWSSQVALYRSISEMEDNLMQLAYQKRWVEVAYTLKEWAERRDYLPSTFQIKAAALSLFTGRQDLFNIWVQPIVDEGFNSLENIDMSHHLQEHTLLYCMVSFVLGWSQPHRENGGIGGEGVKFYFDKRRDGRQRGHLSSLLRGSALAGKWLGAYMRNGTKVAERIVRPDEVKQVLEVLIERKRTYNETAYYHEIATRSIIEILVECSTFIGGTTDRIVYEFIKNYSQSYPANYMMELCWQYLWNRGDEELLEKWFLHWCGPAGNAWHEEVGTRVDVVKRLSDLADQIGFQQEAERALQLLKWGMIGYTNHKEYVLDRPVEWYNELAKVSPGIWRNEGKILLEINQEATELGDNRSTIILEAIVAGSVAREGASAMWHLLNAQNMKGSLVENVRMLFDGLISVLETAEVSATDLLSIWSFGIGTLNWQGGYERCYLEDLKKAILIAAERNNISSLNKKLEVLGQAEYYVKGEQDRYRIPSRWYEDSESHILSNDQQEKELYRLLKEQPVEKAIDCLITMAESESRSRSLWWGIHLVASRLKLEKPAGYPKHLQRLVELLLTQNYTPYEWSGYGIYLAYEALVPLVRDSVRFDLLRKIIANFDFEMDEPIWLDSAAKNLDDFCRFRAASMGREDLHAGLQRHLTMHQMWIRGNGFLPDMVRIELPDVVKIDSMPETWFEFATRYFFRILQSNNLTRIELALRGLWSLAQVSPTDLNYIAENWNHLNYGAKERILLLVERLAISNPIAYEPFSEIVKACYEGVNLSLKLQAWVILQAVEHRTGEQCPEWQLPRHPEYEELLSKSSVDRGVLEVPSIPRGLAYELHGIDIVHSLLKRLQMATRDEVTDIEYKFAAYSDINPNDLGHVEPVLINSGQMGVRNLPYRDYLMKLIYHELYIGRWKDVPIGALAQALLKSDEPFVFLQSPAPAVDAEEWLTDYGLDELSGNKKKILERFLPRIHAGLSEDEVVVGAVLHTYSWSMDVEIVFDTVLRNKGFELIPVNEQSTMNGRTFSLYSSDRFDPQDMSYPVIGMTCKAGGIGEFNSQSMLCYPLLTWDKIFRWQPSKTNPLIWLEDSEPVARFEYFHGRIRDSAQDYFYRQPILQRWVCSKKALNKIETELNVMLSSTTFVNVRPGRGESV
ncbi:ATP-binding protein [Domibacillus tundrae]|uniref:ATP-binding protein n=1 Tax=Domibacillus tundrae TaxID=1587527 RepID=UPI0006182FBE|nr:ATP-binding protein [Domibacillus tundrae]